MINEIIERYEDELFLKADGFDDAVIGVDENQMRLIYSVSKCIEILSAFMTEEEASKPFFCFFFVYYLHSPSSLKLS